MEALSGISHKRLVTRNMKNKNFDICPMSSSMLQKHKGESMLLLITNTVADSPDVLT